MGVEFGVRDDEWRLLTRLGMGVGMLNSSPRRLNRGGCAEYYSGDDGELGAWRRRERRSTEEAGGVETEVGAAEAAEAAEAAARAKVREPALLCLVVQGAIQSRSTVCAAFQV